MEDAHFGNKGSVAYGEAFQRLKPMVRYTLPVTDAELSVIDEPIEAMMGRRSETIGGLMPLPEGARNTSEYRFTPEMYKDA